jgi:hypothetical protein
MIEFNMADTGGMRNETPLTEAQFNQAKDYAVSLGMPKVAIFPSEEGLTGYCPGIDVLRIGTDVLPAEQRQKRPNSNISLKGTIAHEIVGHRDASLKGFTQPDSLLEEAQASIRAARFAPDLSRQEKEVLLRDGIYRLNRNGISIREVKDKLFINER